MINGLDMDLTPVIAEQPDPLLFATVSGVHLLPATDATSLARRRGGEGGRRRGERGRVPMPIGEPDGRTTPRLERIEQGAKPLDHPAHIAPRG
ncbi:hypothetical protein ACFY0A_39110 [Streptomyces sp. NPDC001698]|uniref:hypothetical protein n=1 Tax=unclassified Streptomyces TaxID=2593676 RepID=UPI003676B78F